MKIMVEYFALLKEQRGLGTEAIETKAATPHQLYEELKERHDFTLDRSHLKVAVNEDFSDWDCPLSHEDTVVFIPPVAGG